MKRHMVKTLFVWCFTLCVWCCPIFADDAPSAGPSTDALFKESKSPDPKIRIQLAKRLASNHNTNSFQVLLSLLRDPSLGVSYAAAEAIEIRGDQKFDGELIQAIRALPRENRWPAYRAEKNYPTKRTVEFLLECLQDEIAFYRKQKNFDERNSFYIAKSLETLGKHFPEIQAAKAPEDTALAAYEKFAIDLQRSVKAKVSRNAK